MGRKKFSIANEMDSLYMKDYLYSNVEIIKNEFYDTHDAESRSDFDGLILALSDIENTEENPYRESFYHSLQNMLLALLNTERVNKIRITIRAKRMMSGHKGKKQITIDIDVHEKLKKYASSHNLTLSDAINYLLVEFS